MVWFNEVPMGYHQPSRMHPAYGQVKPRRARPVDPYGGLFGAPYNGYGGYDNEERIAYLQHQKELEARREFVRRQKQERQKVHRRLNMIKYTIAARTIQRWWRNASAARKETASKIIRDALQRNVAVKQARQIASSIRNLLALEDNIEAFPDVTDVEASGSDKASVRARLVFEHTLEKLVLSADDIPTHGSESARAIRKRLVLRANARLSAHDERIREAASRIVDVDGESDAETPQSFESSSEDDYLQSDNNEIVEMDCEVPDSQPVLDMTADGETANDDDSKHISSSDSEDEASDHNDGYNKRQWEDRNSDDDVISSDCSLSADVSSACVTQLCKRFKYELSEIQDQLGHLPDDQEVSDILQQLINSVSKAQLQLEERSEA
jgi:hypothetical protein